MSTFPLFAFQSLLTGLTGGIWWHTQHPFSFGTFVVCAIMAIHGALVFSGRK